MKGLAFAAALALASFSARPAQAQEDPLEPKKKSCCPAPLCTMPKDYQCVYGPNKYPSQEDSARLSSLGFRYFCGEKTRSCIGGRVCEKGEFLAYFCRRKGHLQSVTSERDLPSGFYLVRTDPPKMKDAGIEAGAADARLGDLPKSASSTTLSDDGGVSAGSSNNGAQKPDAATAPAPRSERKRRDPEGACALGQPGRPSGVSMLALAALAPLLLRWRRYSLRATGQHEKRRQNA